MDACRNNDGSVSAMGASQVLVTRNVRFPGFIHLAREDDRCRAVPRIVGFHSACVRAQRMKSKNGNEAAELCSLVSVLSSVDARVASSVVKILCLRVFALNGISG